MTRSIHLRLWTIVIGTVAMPRFAAAQVPDARAPVTTLESVQPLSLEEEAQPRTGAELLTPLGSLVFPGLGQYVQGAYLSGAAFTATGVLGPWPDPPTRPSTHCRDGPAGRSPTREPTCSSRPAP